MPAVKIHEAISKKRTGETYADLHKWIDEGKGVNHRRERHFYTTKYKDHVLNNFGGHEAVSEWLFHIALDNLNTSVINDRDFGVAETNLFKIGFEENGYIHYEGSSVENFENEF